MIYTTLFAQANVTVNLKNVDCIVEPYTPKSGGWQFDVVMVSGHVMTIAYGSIPLQWPKEERDRFKSQMGGDYQDMKAALCTTHDPRNRNYL